MRFNKKYTAIAFSAPIIVTAPPPAEVEAVEDKASEDTLPTPETKTPETEIPRIEIKRNVQKRGGLALQLFERRDGVFEESKEVVQDSDLIDTKHGLIHDIEEIETGPQSTMKNPIAGGLLEKEKDIVVPEEHSTDGIARIADDVIDTILLRKDEEPTDINVQESRQLTESKENTTVANHPQTEREKLSLVESASSLNFKGIEVLVPTHLQSQFSIEIDGNTLFIRDKSEQDQVSRPVTAANEPANEQANEFTSLNNEINETPESYSESLQLDELAQRVRDTAKPAGDGLYFMPNPTIKDGKITYLFDKNTCNSERRGYPEHIAAVLAITDKYKELVATKYPQYKDTILDIGDFMSHVHIEHDGDNPAVDLRSRKISTQSGIFDGPAFVPNSPNYDVDLTVELIEYLRTLEYEGTPILKYAIIKNTDGLDEKTQHLNRYYINRNIMIFKDDHPEHIHLALTLFDESKNIEPEEDYGYPCPVSGTSFTEAHQVTEITNDNFEPTNVVLSQSSDSVEENYLHAASPGIGSNTNIDVEPIVVDNPELIEFLREEAQKDNQLEQQSSTTETNPSLQTITDSIPDRTPVDKSAIRIGEINESSELARIMYTSTLTDGSRNANEIVDDLSLHAQQLLNSIDAYAPVSPYTAASLRQENPSYTPYIKQLQNVDRRLSEQEMFARAKVAHEIVFGERYGSEYAEDKIKSDVERLVAFSIRESQRYPGAVGDYKTESENSGSSGLMQILDWDVKIDPANYEGIRDFDANLDPMQNLIHAFQIVDQNRQKGRSAFADWESGWKSDEGRRSDMEKYEENLDRIRQEGIYDKINNLGGTV